MTDAKAPSRSGLHHVEAVMGTAVSIDLRDEGAKQESLEAVVSWLHHVDDTFSTHRLDSPISALGRGETALSDASPEIQEVLRLCESMFLETEGDFNVFDVPAPNGTRFDPSGLVKGWSVQRAAEMLEARGCMNFCINAGGDVALRGNPKLGESWKVGIRHPHDAQALATVLTVSGSLAIATSASYERGAHIVKPETGEYVSSLASATIVGPDLAIADAYSTALYVKGAEGLSWLTNCHGYDGYVITQDGATQWTDGFNRYKRTTEQTG